MTKNLITQNSNTEKILVTGAFGQIGTDLVPALQEKYGKENIVALGHKTIPEDFDGILETGDVRDEEFLKGLQKKYKFTQIYHMVGILSARGEKDPQQCWDVNIRGLKNILDLAIEHKLRIFWPSSIAVFGPTTPRENTPQHTVLEPTTMYGVTKLGGELLCQYYFQRYGLDVRSLRYPGIISWKAEAGGGTTDYAVDIYYKAVEGEKFVCFVNENTVLPMMYMDDAIKATLMLMDAPSENIKIRTSYNLTGMSFSVKELVAAVKKYVPELQVEYKPDHRQKIADSWPMSIDHSKAQEDWNWQPDYGLDAMTQEMLEKLKKKLVK